MPNLTDQDIEYLLLYARGKFEEERYPFAPALRPVREVLGKVDHPKPKAEPPAPRKPYVPSLATRKKQRRSDDL